MRMGRTLTLLAAAVLVAAAAPAPVAARGKVLKFPKFAVPPRSDREVCMFLRLPKKKAMDVAGSLIVNRGGNESFVSHHFLMWQYEGTDFDAFPAGGQIVDGEACLDFGPSDTTRRTLIAGSQSPRFLTRLPSGLAQQIQPAVDAGNNPIGIGLILNTHWINASDKTQFGSVKIKLLPAKGKVKRYVQPLFEVIANGFIKTAPGTTQKSSWGWAPKGLDFGAGLGGGKIPDGPACVVQITAHMHKRGTLFTVDHVKPGQPPTRLFETADYSDPGQRIFNGEAGNAPPLLVKVGEQLRYECTHNNGTFVDDHGATTRPRMGCEEEPGVPPGKSGAETFLSGKGLSGAAKLCEVDADCPPTDPGFPNRTFTGRCVEAFLVFGYTSHDDMCILPGAYFDAIPDAPPGRECDLSLLP